MHKKNQQGVVLVVALFIVALVAAMAYVMVSRLERDTARSLLLGRNSQAELYAQGSIAWAKEALRIDWERRKNNALLDRTPIISPINTINGYQITSTIYDMQARFNLNNLTTLNAQADFIRLLKVVDASLSEQQAKEIAQATTDWVTSAQKPSATTESSQQTKTALTMQIESPQLMPKPELMAKSQPVQMVSMQMGPKQMDKYYLHLSPPYRAPHQLMVSASELQLVKGMTPILFQKLKPFISALPIKTNINVQTAPEQVLMTLAPTITFATAKAIVRLRAAHPILSPQAFAALDVIKNHPVPTEKIATTSQYFLLETKVSIENQHLLLYTLIERATNDTNSTYYILWQSKNMLG